MTRPWGLVGFIFDELNLFNVFFQRESFLPFKVTFTNHICIEKKLAHSWSFYVQEKFYIIFNKSYLFFSFHTSYSNLACWLIFALLDLMIYFMMSPLNYIFLNVGLVNKYVIMYKKTWKILSYLSYVN